jgi:hypothetical protein
MVRTNLSERQQRAYVPTDNAQNRSSDGPVTDFACIKVVEPGHGSAKREQPIRRARIRYQTKGEDCMDSDFAQSIKIDLEKGLRRHSGRCSHGNACLGTIELAWRFENKFRAYDSNFHVIRHSSFPSRDYKAEVCIDEPPSKASISSQDAYPVELKTLCKDDRRKQAALEAEEARRRKAEDDKRLIQARLERQAKRQSTARYPSPPPTTSSNGSYRHSSHSPAVAAMRP